jgi:predicted Zn finger-like uncharacterized protein
MILTCPACDTKYVVKDGAIPPGGRLVRCASCKHSWHQDPDAEAQPPADEQSIAEAALIDPGTGPEAEERAYQEATIADEVPDTVADDLDVAAAPTETTGDSEPASPPERDQWATPDPEPETDLAPAAPAEPEAREFEPFFEPDPVEPARRRVPLLVWLLLLVAVLAVAGWFLAPESIRTRLGLAGDGGTPLEVMVTNSDRQRLASGNELFAVSGRVINPTDEDQAVPPLRAELLDASRQRVVYSWTIAPPATSLGPGASASFNSAEVDVPQGGSHLRVTLGGPAA